MNCRMMTTSKRGSWLQTGEAGKRRGPGVAGGAPRAAAAGGQALTGLRTRWWAARAALRPLGAARGSAPRARWPAPSGSPWRRQTSRSALPRMSVAAGSFCEWLAAAADGQGRALRRIPCRASQALRGQAAAAAARESGVACRQCRNDSRSRCVPPLQVAPAAKPCGRRAGGHITGDSATQLIEHCPPAGAMQFSISRLEE